MPKPKSQAISPEAATEVAARTIHTVDGLWFLAVEEEYGFEAAFELNQQVWKRGAFIHGKRLLKNMNVKGNTPFEALATMILADPIMSFRRTQVMTQTDSRLVIRTLNCPPAEARYRDGRGVFNGVPGCTLLLATYAGLIDPRIQTKCVCCTPNPENPEYWCEWEFTLPQDNGNER